MSSEETETALGLLEILHGDFSAPNIKAFVEFTDREHIFERLVAGQSFIFVGSHLEFQDVGFNLGYLSRAAQQRGFDRLDTRVTLMIGRLLGYLEVMGMNVIDDILRKAANVLKTFPVSGGEAVNEGDITDEDLNRRVKAFRRRQNAHHPLGVHEPDDLGSRPHRHRGRQRFTRRQGRPRLRGDGAVRHGTREDLYDAVRAGASIYPIFGDYGDRDEPSIVEFGAEIRHLDESAPRARDRRDHRRHGQPRSRRGLGEASRGPPLQDPDPVRQLRGLQTYPRSRCASRWWCRRTTRRCSSPTASPRSPSPRRDRTTSR